MPELATCRERGFHEHSVPQDMMWEYCTHIQTIDGEANDIKVHIDDFR